MITGVETEELNSGQGWMIFGVHQIAEKNDSAMFKLTMPGVNDEFKTTVDRGGLHRNLDTWVDCRLHHRHQV